jgi:hypothetical protein
MRTKLGNRHNHRWGYATMLAGLLLIGAHVGCTVQVDPPSDSSEEQGDPDDSTPDDEGEKAKPTTTEKTHADDVDGAGYVSNTDEEQDDPDGSTPDDEDSAKRRTTETTPTDDADDSEPNSAVADATDSGVFVNREELTVRDADATGLPEGKYWYDALSGLWGVEGDGYYGITVAGLDIGGTLRRDASAGTSGVLLNGRELTTAEVRELEGLLYSNVPKGSYFLDSAGNFGFAGGPALFNIGPLTPSSGGAAGSSAGGGDNFWSTGNATGNESGGAGYSCVDGSCVSYGM